MAKWAIKLNKFDISYCPRLSMKVQVLVDFFVECTWLDDKLEEELAKQLDLGMIWILHVDEALNSQWNGARLILSNSERGVVEYALYFSFKVTNNQVEY